MTGVESNIMPEVLRLDAEDLQSQWLRFKQQFQDIVTQRFGDMFSKLSETTKLDIFLNCVGQEANELYFNVLKTKENMKYEDIIQLFDDHIASQNELNSRFNFNQRNQKNGESFDEFYTEIKKLVKTCKYQEQDEIMLRDRVVSGVLDVNLQRKLLENNSLTLQQAVDICQDYKHSNKQDQPRDEPVTDTRIIEDLKSNEMSTKMVAVRAARRKLMMKTNDNHYPFTASVVKAGIIGSLVDGLSSHCSDLQFEAAWTITCLAHDPNHISALVKEDAIPSLVEMVSRGGALGEQAARALGTMALNDVTARIRSASEGAIAAICPHLHRDTATCQLRTYLWACSAISMPHPQYIYDKEIMVGLHDCEECLPHIAELLTVRDEEIILHACSVLHEMTKNSGEHIEAVLDTPSMLTRLIALFERDSVEVKTSAVRVLGNLAFDKDAQTEKCVDAGFLDKIIDLHKQVLEERKCGDGKSELQYLVTRALATISCFKKGSQILIERGAIPILVSSLSHGGDTAERATCGLGNIATENDNVRNEIVNNGALSAILPLMSPATPSHHLEIIVWAFKVMCSHNTPAALDLVSPGLPNIANLLTVKDDKVLNEVLLALESIIDWNSESIDAVQATPSLMTRLTALLEHESLKIKAKALTLVGTMLAGNEDQADRCLDAECLDRIVALMRCSTPSLVKTATWAASNVFAGNHSQIERALERDMLEAVVHVLETGNNRAKDDAIWAINNLCIGGTTQQRSKLVTSSVLTAYCGLLSSESNGTVLLVLTGLVDLIEEFTKTAHWNAMANLCKLLRATKAIDKVQELRTHDDEKISNKATVFDNAYNKADCL